MNTFSRREFIKTTGLASMASIGFSFNTIKKSKPLLSFSTLGCPDWTFKSIVGFAKANGYDGLELRGILRELDLLKCPEFNNTENIRASRKLMEDNGLQFVNLGSSTNLHQPEGEGRKKQIDDGKRFIDLAHQIGCPFIRVFPNNFPKDQERTATLELISNGLIELGNYAKDSNVKVLMETHGEVVYTADIEKIMKTAEHPQVGLIWDALNMWTITKESPSMVYEKLKKYIFHTHIKNATLLNDKISYVLLEKGDVPIFEAIDALAKGGYHGYYSFEWEKLWHPEIESPEIALADYPKAMTNHFNNSK